MYVDIAYSQTIKFGSGKLHSLQTGTHEIHA